MEIINVIIAAAASFALGAVWYMALANPWMEAAGIERDADGKPKGGQDPKIFALTFVMQLLVAGMMRHTFELSGVDSYGKGIVAGIGIGLFFISPWIVINNLYGNRPLQLSVIDGGYATLACGLMGLVLTLF
ncbi:DUF1761 domain-containing protein [Marinovum sp. 2_MG-2023]|uniref:DUF1761 domain-containing protein n=1 Tax=unclassified Marinovum TaxID=2647166 RepID=UPI0026E198A0|nr:MULTISPECIES: DUF1761 domain-containing protein [unclassified Marinovum]MDO6730624.1 DUF1761 domain-containing protein [Marinovum sp. 2_MG-2023]MDO6778775.1 DUF1761 domain-containing protein [Marinovum sp. 1_MG-2023]